MMLVTSVSQQSRGVGARGTARCCALEVGDRGGLKNTLVKTVTLQKSLRAALGGQDWKDNMGSLYKLSFLLPRFPVLYHFIYQ